MFNKYNRWESDFLTGLIEFLFILIIFLGPILLCTFLVYQNKSYNTQKDADKSTCYIEKEWVKCPQAGFKVKSNLIDEVYSIQKSDDASDLGLFYFIQIKLTNGESATFRVGKKNLDEVTKMLEDLALENGKNQ
mgnify:CR=1 FL=1